MAKLIEKLTVNQINKLIEKNIPCLIYQNYNGWLIVDEWEWLKPNENYADPNHHDYQYNDGSFCGLVAIVGEHCYPYMTIEKIMICKEIEIK
jgi:hypothetical protein